MATVNDGGPAFPVESTDHAKYGIAGMSLRDWFAGMALQGMLAASDGCGGEYRSTSEQAYRFADAMIAQRDKRQASRPSVDTDFRPATDAELLEAGL